MRHSWGRQPKMKRGKLTFLAPMLPLILALAACSPAPTPVAQVPTAVPTTAAPTATTGPTRTLGPTYTPLFPTYTETVATATRATLTSTLTVTPAETLKPLFTETSTPTNTPTVTPTETPTITPTNAPTPTDTAVPTATPVPQSTANPSVNPAYDREVQADKPVGYWRLDETSGMTAFDTSGGNHPGKYSGGYTFGTPSSTPNTYTSSPTFDGTGQVEIDGVLPTGSAARTLELWFLQADANNRQILGSGTGQGSWVSAILGGQFVLNSAGPYTLSATVLAPRIWHYVALTYDGKDPVQIYLDGVPIRGSADLTLNTNSADLILAAQGLEAGWAGSLADVAVYDHVLPAERIVRHYAVWFPAQVLNPVGVAALSAYDRAVLTAHPVDYWPLDSTSDDPQQASKQTLTNLISGFCPASFGGSDYKIGVPGALALGQDKGVSFGGSSDITLCGRGMLPVGSSPRTVELWFKSEDSGGRTMFVYGGPGNGHIWEITEASNFFGLHYWGAGVMTNIALPLDTWHYAAITFDGDKTVKIYADGKQVGGDSVGTINTTWDYVRIGGPGYNPFWIGSVDEVAVYDYVLTPVTIAQHFQLAINPPTVVF